MEGAVQKKPRNGLIKLRTLVMMQLKDKLDFSFVKSVRSTIIKTVMTILKLAVTTVLFWLIFYVCNLLSVFYPVGYIPDKAVNVLFTALQIMSVVTCSVGLTKALYMTQDNRVLLTFPVGSTTVYMSKLILYYIFELRKNIGLTLPLLVAYGIINGAIWYYYPYLIVCFLFVSLIPVAIGAVLSIPLILIWQMIKSKQWFQTLLAVMGISAVIVIVILAILGIPENIDIMGQWYAITLAVGEFLDGFATVFAPFYYVTLMMVGGTLRIRSNLIGLDTLMYFGILLASVAALIGLSFLVARPMFVWMASKQFEYEKKVIPPKKNHVFNKRISPVMESLTMEFKSIPTIVGYVIQLILPAIATLLLNKVYNAMYTNYTGLVMTKTFNFLVMLVMTLAFNNAYASVYSKEAAARNILKTRPQKPIYTLVGRILPRAAVILVSTIAVMVVYLSFSSRASEVVLMSMVTLLVSEAHLLWCAETDIMHSYAEQYQTVGVFDSPNERNCTIIGFLLAALFAFMFYFLQDRGTESSLIKCFVVALCFLAARVYLFVTRAKLYFAEN